MASIEANPSRILPNQICQCSLLALSYVQHKPESFFHCTLPLSTYFNVRHMAFIPFTTVDTIWHPGVITQSEKYKCIDSLQVLLCFLPSSALVVERLCLYGANVLCICCTIALKKTLRQRHVEMMNSIIKCYKKVLWH